MVVLSSGAVVTSTSGAVVVSSVGVLVSSFESVLVSDGSEVSEGGGAVESSGVSPFIDGAGVVVSGGVSALCGSTQLPSASVRASPKEHRASNKHNVFFIFHFSPLSSSFIACGGGRALTAVCLQGQYKPRECQSQAETILRLCKCFLPKSRQILLAESKW